MVPEMNNLTVERLINGMEIESSSHKYKLFQEIVKEMELLLKDGTVVVPTANNEYITWYTLVLRNFSLVVEWEIKVDSI